MNFFGAVGNDLLIRQSLWFEKGKYFDKTSPDGQVNALERVSQLRMGEVIHFCQ